MENWTQAGFAGLGSAIVIICAVIIARRMEDAKERRKNDPQGYRDRNPSTKRLSDLQEGDAIVVVAMSELQRPIAQFAHDFEEEKYGGEQPCFILLGVNDFKLEHDRRYILERKGPAHIPVLRQL